jgi:hypothetical protein
VSSPKRVVGFDSDLKRLKLQKFKKKLFVLKKKKEKRTRPSREKRGGQKTEVLGNGNFFLILDPNYI